MDTIGFIGLGKLGLECAEVFAQTYAVQGYDIYPRISHSVQITDLQTVIEYNDWLFIAVPTPHESGYDGSTPSSHLPPKNFALDAVGQVLKNINDMADRPKKIALISTVLPGTVRSCLENLLDHNHTLLYNPYLIAMGSVKWDMVNPEMIIIGAKEANDPAIYELMALYEPIMQNHPRYVTGTWEEAESIKIFYNTFISAKVGLVNMIQDFAMKIGNINVDVVTDALAQSDMRIMGPKYMTAGMGDAGACHPRDNIALRWLAQKYDIGYDIFDTIMSAREKQAKNLADFLCGLAVENCCPIVLHGKAYKPDVSYCVGSYSTLIAHYIKKRGFNVKFVDPLADDGEDIVNEITERSVILLAHNRIVTYGYTGQDLKDLHYCDFPKGSVLVDPWRKQGHLPNITVIHYGNTRNDR